MTSVVLEEIPDRVSLAVDISNCRGNCVGCHSPFLKFDIGEELTPAVVDALLAANFGVNCFLFLGEGSDPVALIALARCIREAHPSLDLALYSGREEVEKELWDVFDYIKLGPYRPEFGPLNERTTNQRLYRVLRPGTGTLCAGVVSESGNAVPGPFFRATDGPLPDSRTSGVPVPAEDITYRFWRKGIDPQA